jgi:hypothetical protein
MIKSKAVVEVTLNDRIYTMDCPQEAPLGEVHDALCMMKAVVIARINEYHKMEEENKIESCCEQACEG